MQRLWLPQVAAARLVTRRPSQPPRSAAVGAIPIHAMRSGVDSLGARCRAKGNCFGTLHEEVTRTARDLLTEAGAKRIMDHGRAHLTVMRLPPGSLKPWQEMVSNFTGRDDIVDAVGATCYIPGYAGPSATIKWAPDRPAMPCRLARTALAIRVL